MGKSLKSKESERAVGKIKLVLAQKGTGEKEQERNEFAKLAKDPRLTEAENAFLVERLMEVREAFIELLLKKRQKSHDRDFVAG